MRNILYIKFKNQFYGVYYNIFYPMINKMPDKFRIGRHMGIGPGFSTIPEYVDSLGYNIFQIFLAVPRKILSKAKQDKELISFGNELRIRDLRMVIHGNYTINLCHPKGSVKYEASVKSLIQDMISSAVIGIECMGVIIHMGKNVTENAISAKEALDNYVIGLQEVLVTTPEITHIILETGASQGTEIASKIDGLAEIYHKLNYNEKSRVKFCIDTCHIWATGYDISSSSGVREYFDEFEKKIGINKIACIHYNDSRNTLGSHVDRHADLGYGLIGINGLKTIAQFAKMKKIPLIMETPLDAIDSNNTEITADNEFKLVKTWIK
jgi:apurinic endonuclease APN1